MAPPSELPRHLKCHPRTGMYWYRRVVPEDLRASLGKREISRSLGTKNQAEAIMRVAEVHRCVSQEIERAAKPSATCPTHQSEVTSKALLSLEDTETLALRWQTEAVAEYAEQLARRGGMGESAHSVIAAANHAQRFLRRALQARDYSPVRILVHRHLNTLGHAGDPEATRMLGYAFLRAAIAVEQEIIRIGIGDSPLGTHRRAQTSPRAAGMLLNDAFERYASERQLGPKARHHMALMIARLLDVVGQPAHLTDITREKLLAWKELLMRMPARPKHADRDLGLRLLVEKYETCAGSKVSVQTVRREIGLIQALLSWCKANGLVSENVAQGMKPLAGHGADRRLPFSADDLRAIFTGSLYQGGKVPADYRWLPILALHTGCRLEELGQLTVDDVRFEDGIWHLDINTLEAGKRLKTAGSRRRIPLHQNVMSCGFLEYAEHRRTNGGQWLFENLRQDRHGTRTSAFSRWFGRYLREVGITDRRKVFHSLRHTFKTACRLADIPEAMHDQLTGHVNGSVGRTYGSGYSLKQLADAIGRINFPGFPLMTIEPQAR